MENKDPNGTLLSKEPESVSEPPDALHTPPLESNGLSLEPTDQQPLISQEQPKSKVHRFLRLTRRLDVLLAVLLLIAGAVVLFNVFNNKSKNQEDSSSAAASRFGTVKIPLGDLISGRDLSLAGAANVTINGTMQLNNALLLSPTVQPTGARPGQIYYDQTTNQLAYFNGEVFVFLTAAGAGGVQSLGGATGQLTLGDGLTLANGQLSNAGVLSVQGQSGDVTFTAGPGLVINGTTFSNSGVLSVASGSPNVSVTNDGSGNVTISMVSGAGTVTSSGGTAGIIPLFTGAQNIEDSIITQSGLTVTISGDLSVVTGGLSLSNALTVSNGGTGATSFANNGVLVGQGTGAFASVAAGGAGLCLISTAGLPAWGACPGGGGVTTLDGLSGALSIANTSGAGSVITIDDASTSGKGIASFSSTNFTVASGAVNTIQNINTGATPTFAGLNTNNITPSAALTVGSATQQLTLQGNAATQLTATNGANTTALAFVTPTANVTYRLQTATAGTYDICTTVGNCVSSGAVTTPGGTTNRLAKFTGSQIIGDSIVVDNGSNVDIGGTLSVQGSSTLTGDIAVNGGDITSTGALNITPGGTLTVGVTGQQLTLQGNASTTLAATNGGSTTSLTFQSPTASVTYRLPTAAAGTYDVCTTAGNCVGSGGGVTTSGGTPNRLAKFTGTQAINDSTISDDGTNVTTSVDLIIQGGDVTVGVASSQTGSIKLAHSASAFVGTILQGALTANHTYTLPDADGTICLTSGNCSGSGSSNTLQAAYDAGNTILTTTARNFSVTLADSATDANFVITAATGSTGYVGVVRADGVGTADPAQLLLVENLDTDRVQPVGIRVQSAGGGMTTAIDASDAEIVTAINVGANDIVGTTGNIDLTNFDVAGATGNITTPGTVNGQTISSTASFTGTVAVAGNATLASDLAVNGGDITSTGALNITPGGTLTVGVTGQQLVLQGSANTQLTATGGGFTTTLGFAGTPTGAVNYNFDRAAAAGTYTICTTVGNCAGTGGGVTTPGGTTGAIAKFTGAQTLGDSLLSETGATVTVNGNLNLVPGNQFQVNGTQISSANLSNDANLAKLSASQTFTGNMISFRNGTNSTNAFNVQNAAGNPIITVDSSSAQLVLGDPSALDGKLVFNNVSNANTVTILPGTPTANRTLTLPDASGVICTDSGNCAGAGATLQTAYNFSVGGTTPKIKVNSSLGGVDIQDADTTIGANLLNVRASNGLGLGSVLFGVGNTGAVTLQNSANSTTAFRLLTAGGTTVLVGDTTNGQVLLGQSSTLSGALVFRNASNANTITLTTSTPTADRSINLPDSSGTICLTSGNCSGSGSSNTLQAAYDAGNTVTTTTARDVLFTMADSATDANFLVNLQCDTSCGSSGRFAIQDDGVDTFSVSPSGSALFKPTANSTTAFQVQPSGSTTPVFNVDTTNARIGIGMAAPSYALDVVGSANISSGSTYKINGVDICTASGCTPAAGSSSYIQNGTSTQTAANFNIQSAAAGSVGAVLKGAGSQTADLLQFQNSSSDILAKFGSNGQLTLGRISASGTTQAGSVVFADGSNDNFGATLNTTTLTASRTIALPDASGTVCLQNSVACGFLTGSTSDYIQNQNSSSQTANFRISGTGRADTALQAPAFDTPTATVLAIGQTNATGITLYQNTTFASGKTVTIQGNTAINPAADSTTVLNVKTSLGNNMFTVDTTNGRVGIGLGSSNLPTLQSTGLEIKGAIRLSGANSSYSDRYLTPSLGSPVDSLINVVNYNPNINGQIIAMGLPSTADTTTRVVSLFDARSGAHQPTLAVFSPSEGAIGGFSWDGSNTDFSVKNTVAGAIKLNINGTDRVIATATGIGINTTPSYAVDASGDANVTGVYRIGGTPICTSTGCTAASTSAILNQNVSTQSASFKIQGPGISTNTGTIVAFTAQDKDLLQFQSAAGTPMAGIRPSGSIYSAAVTNPVTDVPANARLFVQPVTNSSTAIIARAASGGAPTGDIMQLQNAGGSVNVFSVGVAGATTITNSSTAALNVQNASSASVFNVNTSTTVISMASGNAGVLPTFTAAANMPVAREAHNVVSVNGYLYVVGGCVAGGGADGSVQYSKIRNDGSVGTWTTTTPLPQANCNAAATSYGGYIYVNGGTGSAALSNDIYVGKVNADGTVTSWQTLTDAMPKDLRLHTMQAANGYLYATGGKQENFTINRDMYYFAINADGTLGSATTSSNFLAVAGQSAPCSVIANGYLYIIGGDGSGSAVVTYSLLNALTGAPAAANTTTAMGLYRSDCSAVVSSGYLYVLGSLDSGGVTAHSEIYSAQLNSGNGTVSAWTQTATSLPGNRSNAGAVVVNGYIYFVGGWDGSTAQNNVWYTSPARVSIGGNLDLLATNTGTNGMTDGGSTGGNLTAGNTFISGTLTVTGATQIRDSINIGNNLSVGGQGSFKNATNTATAFQVLNASSVPQFVVDTSNSRVYIGNPTADSTGALLILDTKNTSGDPTGVNGGMYYNSNTGKMRCYEQNYWRDCSMSARTGFYYANDMTTVEPDSVSIRDALGTGADNDGAVVGATAQHPGIVQQQTGTTSSGAAYFGSADAAGTSILLGNGDTWRYESVVRIPTLSTGAQRFSYRVGFLDGGVGTDTDGNDGCFMKYNDNINGGRWQGVCNNNTTISTCDTGITAGANTWYRLTVLVNSAGTSADFQTDGVSRCQVTTNIPTGAGRQTAFQNTLVKTIGTTERVVDLDYLEIQGFFSR